MTGDHRGPLPAAGRPRYILQFGQVMQDAHRYASGRDDPKFRKLLRPIAMIVVAPYRKDRRDTSERLEHRRVADVTRVDDDIGAFQGDHGLRAEKAMSVRDDSNQALVWLTECMVQRGLVHIDVHEHAPGEMRGSSCDIRQKADQPVTAAHKIHREIPLSAGFQAHDSSHRLS